MVEYALAGMDTNIFVSYDNEFSGEILVCDTIKEDSFSAIKKLKDSNVHIHNAMEKAFLALYGYTSDENGIRHGGIDFTSVPSEDAKYMLVSCSAFVNYLMEKWSKVDAKVGGMHIEKLH